jgi:His-Xaa-Ser system protein HxsD
MLEVRTTPAERRVVVALDEASCPRAAVFAAAFSLIDRCWVHLDRKDGRLEVSLRTKRAEEADLDSLAAQFRDELLGHAWRQKLVEDGRDLLESLAVRAYGASAPPDQAGSIDDLLAGDAGAFDDPLGIAMSWEEKYAKKSDGGAP